MKILMTGGSGFIGRPLCEELVKAGHELTLVTRKRESMKNWELPSEILEWDAENSECPISLDPFDAIIHLMGEPIAGGRWTKERKKSILNSRVATTQNLGRALALRLKPLPLLISASAIGYYPYAAEEVMNEEHAPGIHFLAAVTADWEAAVAACPKTQRRLSLRFGLVLGPDGGFLKKMLPPARAGVLGKVGDGKQWMSWIHRHDLIRIILKAMGDDRYQGVINAVSPEPVRNEDFSRSLTRLLGRPLFIPTPRSVLRLTLGEMAEIVTESQKVSALKLQALGFRFVYPQLKEALMDAANIHVKDGKTEACQRFTSAQFIPRPLPEVFAFFSDPKNLERITPPLLAFQIKDMSTAEVREGTIINYRLKLHGLPLRWKTLIREWDVNRQFVDSQESGPYVVWHHRHEFFPVPGGTLMTDSVLYKLPLGLLGEAVAHPLVVRDVRKIFAYRRQVIHENFPG